MVDEDFVMGYAVGYNDGVSSGGSGGGLDDYPIFQNKKFRVGDSDFYFMVGDINSGFFDRLLSFDEYIQRNSDGKIVLMKYDADCVEHDAALFLIAEKSGKRFLAVNLTSMLRRYKSKSYDVATGIDSITTTTYYLDSVSFKKSSSHSSYGYQSWKYDLYYDYHYVVEYPNGNSYIGNSSSSTYVIQGIDINDDGSVSSLPWGFHRNGCEIVCNDENSYMELLDLMMTHPDIAEEAENV